LLAIALAGEVDYLVTGDHRAGLFQRGRVGSRTDRFSRDLLR
jgi:predicted nucleic acid-binding protein